MPEIDGARIDRLGTEIEREVGDILAEANEIIPVFRTLDQTLYTSVDVSLAVAYTLATSYMSSMVQGAAECFTGLNEDLTASVQAWSDADDAAAADLS
ncbi:hypothetical protein K3N28_19150 [Glycomyces sp. TRM65418]|uniref:hypothetical protein n=1 Tax=Glycomyces sp. TRM65418 TaxID=2867006 RepID=UPI001CE4C8F4|nr:hypothetical protein [Glycomyces sp. TRM65418]MCC3765179.1 hypothetical protein [Glycomyces sp. TRM65418]QZD54804.1 hypothetical protein K3N28_19055 [Glycomyces sp. TRM65418]